MNKKQRQQGGVQPFEVGGGKPPNVVFEQDEEFQEKEAPNHMNNVIFEDLNEESLATEGDPEQE